MYNDWPTHFVTKDLKMIECMEKNGGSFVKALANAMVHADPNNYVKLVSTFSNYCSEYRKMVKDESKSTHENNSKTL